jgi:hypothetical protein
MEILSKIVTLQNTLLLDLYRYVLRYGLRRKIKNKRLRSLHFAHIMCVGVIWYLE